MLVVELIIVLLAIFLGARLGGIGIGFAVRLQKHLENIWREISLISILPEQKQNHKSIRTLCGL